MKPIVLILLFIFTVQKNNHSDPLKKKNELHKRGTTSYQISPSQNCDPGYYKNCFVIGMYIRTKNLPKKCYCYEKKSQKVKRILKEVVSDKYKPKSSKPKYYPFGGKLEKSYRSIAKCRGDYYVCYSYSLINVTECHCSKNPY